MITDEKLEVLSSSIEEMRTILRGIANANSLEDWIPQREAQKLTGLSKSTLYTLRQRGDITFSTFTGKKIFYRRSDLIRYLDKREKMRA